MINFCFVFLAVLGFCDSNADSQNIKTENFEFIAMEYLGLSNHIYKVIITEDHIVGLEVNGYITVAKIFNIGTTVPFSDIKDPNAYVDQTMAQKYKNVDYDNADLLSMNSKNFRIKRSDISSLKLSKKIKAGMGYYPYSGRIILKAEKSSENQKKKRDLILVGDQDERVIFKSFSD